ncbi:MAG TPA: phosphatidylglycerol lysyltransferase domain-containing protein [Candidatus Omnitrophota bacterium]|nr:phosphatidylglycerol lysyltransferase domain-containing protein [Candidatus Omnitrophota bacterium]HPD84375.1 phosphatidylglycerol lysyltransferase domain-containing protein [Candidatus Omnitrophota bacterium]HRZ03233.1 phosphatidylglycerol lysyltransferase domain-containing protein [Candidatus Omnitrophota bacterium]
MHIEDVTLRHKDLLIGRLKESRALLSEYSFPNLYLFRKAHHYQVLKDHQEIFIAGKTYDGRSFIMPTGDIRVLNVEYLLKTAAGYDFIFPIAEEWLGMFEEKRFAKEFSEGDSDYIYKTDKISTYKGPKLHGKKNLLNQFLSLYTPQAFPLTQERMDDARDILEAWQQDVGEQKEQTDYYPCREAFELYDALVLCGGIYYVDNEPAGFIIGEEIDATMFALHFAKGKRKFKGMYQYMYNHFANILPKKYEYLNFEQDLGKLALKIAKSSYHPDKVLKKYRISVLR